MMATASALIFSLSQINNNKRVLFFLEYIIYVGENSQMYDTLAVRRKCDPNYFGLQ